LAFITENFLLHGETARRLYHTYAAGCPILDYHCHLPPRDLAANRQFKTLFDIWLEGDHYKWRAMRANGVPERYCTGDADPYDKFLAWARTVPATLRNPLYHWTHLELVRYFGIDELLNENTASAIWERANAQLADPALSAHGILRRFGVACLCTTDDPADSLEVHEQIAAYRGAGTELCSDSAHSSVPVPAVSSSVPAVYPTYRPDAALRTGDAAAFNHWVDRLGATANVSLARLGDFLDALRKRHEAFHAMGCRLSDHGLERCFGEPCSDGEAGRLFDRVRGGTALETTEADRFASYMMLFFGRLDAERGWTKQLHLGAIRNVNSRRLAELGPDTGFDAIGDWPQVRTLAAYLDRLARERALPKIVIYNLNPADNYAFATLAGCFQDGDVAGKIQFGTAWWFLDQKEGMEWQLNALSSAGLLSRFVGMVTDSRSFMSYPRHEYFRRVLCNLVGGDIDRGELPNDDHVVGGMIRNICYGNAVRYLDLPR
jgi:glucuronate isomerase